VLVILDFQLILYKNINVPLSVVLNVTVVSDDIKTQKMINTDRTKKQGVNLGAREE
jgi:hypothetical protein